MRRCGNTDINVHTNTAVFLVRPVHETNPASLLLFLRSISEGKGLKAWGCGRRPQTVVPDLLLVSRTLGDKHNLPAICSYQQSRDSVREATKVYSEVIAKKYHNGHETRRRGGGISRYMVLASEEEPTASSEKTNRVCTRQ